MGEQYDAELIAQLEEQGVTVTEVDKDAFIEATAPLHESSPSSSVSPTSWRSSAT
jgi:TRAP-type transport system periplasmic protein